MTTRECLCGLGAKEEGDLLATMSDSFLGGACLPCLCLCVCASASAALRHRSPVTL